MTPSTLQDWTMLSGLGNHLWQSTLVAAAAGLLMLALRASDARARYWIALGASLKFLVPLAWLVALGSLIPWPAAGIAPAHAATASAVRTIGQPFSLGESGVASVVETPANASSRTNAIPLLVFAIWACGGAAIFFRRWRHWRHVAAAVRRAQPLRSGREIDAWRRLQGPSRPRSLDILASETLLEPCVFGIVRPVVLWPGRLSDRLSDAQMEAILAHELCHVRLQHNLASAGHMFVETIFWFHPLVWWIGARLVEERERACDEDVVRQGRARATYAEGILKVCEFCLESPLACLAGVTGSPLIARIEAIMTHPIPLKIGGWRGLWLAGIGLSVIVAPLGAGAVSAGSQRRPASRVAIAPLIAAAPEGASIQTAADRPSDAVPPLVPATQPARGPALRAVDSQAPGLPGTSRIGGVITDQTGALMPAVTITAVSLSTGATVRQAVSDAEGRYVMTDLAPGVYDVRFELPAFRSVVQRLQVGTGDVIANARLLIGGVTESLTIRAQRSDVSVPDARTATDAQLLSAELRVAESTAGLIVMDPMDYFKLASLYYGQERFTESADIVARGVDLIERRAVAERPAVAAAARVGGSVKEPRKIRDVHPIYPAGALAIGSAGVVILEAKISEAGTVKDPRVLRSVPAFDQAALGAVRQWLFTPTLLNGIPTEVFMTVTLNFAER